MKKRWQTEGVAGGGSPMKIEAPLGEEHSGRPNTPHHHQLRRFVDETKTELSNDLPEDIVGCYIVLMDYISFGNVG